MRESRTKYPIKTSLEVTTEQNAFAALVAAQLAKLSGRIGKRVVSKKAAWRLMNDHCQTCDLFLASISMDTNISTDEGAAS
jgi:hypothetical protein